MHKVKVICWTLIFPAAEWASPGCPLEEVWGRLDPELFQSSGLKNSLRAQESFPLVRQPE